jgi:hypothetical protein
MRSVCREDTMRERAKEHITKIEGFPGRGFARYRHGVSRLTLVLADVLMNGWTGEAARQPSGLCPARAQANISW